MRPARIQPTSPCTVHVYVQQATLVDRDGSSPVVWDPTGTIKSQIVYILLLSPFLQLSLLSLFPFLSLMLVYYTHVFLVCNNLCAFSWMMYKELAKEPVDSVPV